MGSAVGRRYGTPPERSTRDEPAVARPRAAPQPTVQRVLALQRTIGNAQTARLLRQETDPPAPVKTAPQAFALPVEDPDAAVVFKTASATIDGLEVQVTGRIWLTGKAVLVGETLPAKNAAAFVKTKVRQQAAAGFNAAKPTGGGGKIELPLGGNPLALELAAGQSPAFEVSGRFTAAKQSFTVPGLELSDASVTLDATVWISPVKAPPAEAAAAGDSSVKQFSFAGGAANLKDPAAGSKEAPRSATVVSKAAMDAFEAKLPDFVKNHAFFKLPEQRAAFFQQMRAYFGDDTKTIDHFAKLRKAGVKGAGTILHEEAAKRVEAVQAEIGAAKMPSSGGVGWPRSECKVSGRQDLANLHNLGFAVDYNANQAPHFKDDVALRDLVQIVSGRSPTASYGAAPGDSRKIGETYTTGSEEDQKKLDADTKVQGWLDGVAKETESLGAASETFRGSLKTKDDAGAEMDLKPKLLELRKKWFAAKTKPEREAVLAELPTVLKPWLDLVDAQKTGMETKIRAVKLDPAALPTGKDLDTASDAAAGLDTRMEATRKKLATPLKKGDRPAIDKLLAEARKMTGDPAPTGELDDDAALKELERLTKLVDERSTALKQKRWLDRVNALRAKLTGDGAFVFGKAPGPQAVDPGAAQLADQGFYTLQGSGAAGAEAFGPDFVRSMLKHGFTHGGTWGTPDLMHFELRWAGPAAGG